MQICALFTHQDKHACRNGQDSHDDVFCGEAEVSQSNQAVADQEHAQTNNAVASVVHFDYPFGASTGFTGSTAGAATCFGRTPISFRLDTILAVNIRATVTNDV